MESVSKTKPSVSKTNELERNVELQKSHLNQAFNHLEQKFDIILDEHDRDLIRVIVSKVHLEKQALTELQVHQLENADEISRNSKFWKEMSKD
jgi:succinate dehydrogenase flavin-adding protein (antitoxin of CptAB toxin-antitoxin module)